MKYNPIKQLEHFKQVLSQDKKPISFLISAGCPVSIKVEADQKPLIPDVKNLTKLISEDLSSNVNYVKLLSEVDKAKKDKQNIEDILSFVRTMKHVAEGGDVRGFTSKDLSELEKIICSKIIVAVSKSLPNTGSPYHQLASWSHSIEREAPIEIFTTNYDLLTEQALEDLNVPYFDGFVGARNSFFDLRALEEDLIPKHWLRLWKIHGSINWLQLSNNSVTRTNREASGEEQSLIYPSHLKYEQSRKMPYLAFLDRLNAFIKRPSSVMITAGYSFRDEHINDVIYTALNNNPTSTVIALLFGKLSDYELAVNMAKKRPNLVLWGADEALIGSVRGDWEIADKVDAASEYLLKDKKMNLGDFLIFGEFLAQLTGYGISSSGVTSEQ